jgi:hypothetical protein
MSTHDTPTPLAGPGRGGLPSALPRQAHDKPSALALLRLSERTMVIYKHHRPQITHA